MRTVDESGDRLSDKVLPEVFSETGPQIYKQLRGECAKFDLTATVATLGKIIHLLETPGSKFSDYKNLLDEFQGRLEDELDGRYFFSLTSIEADKFNEWSSGWETIIQQFSDTTRDVEEMNKCFALGRYSASMFHALHVAEWGAIRLGDFIGVTDPKKGWGATESKLRLLIKAGHSALPTSIAGKFEFLEQMHREIDSLVLAWRHKVDHAANHLAILPNTDFTPDVAEHVISSVRIFMLRLSEGAR